jgi:uncharacterized protein DUF5343
MGHLYIIFQRVTKIHKNTFQKIRSFPYSRLKRTECSRMFCRSIQEIRMALSKETSAPYAPKAAIIGLLEKNRATGLPNQIDKSGLSRLGISDSLLDRTFQALVILDLIGEDGSQTETLSGLRAAPEAEYKSRLAEWLNHAYGDIIQFADPSEGNEVSVRDAFRTFSPQSQVDRMVSLFVGLYKMAGIWPQVTRTAGGLSTPKSKTTTNAPAPKRTKKTPLRPNLPTQPISEMALEYRLVDLMGEAASDPEVLQSIIKVITYLKTKDSGQQKGENTQ